MVHLACLVFWYKYFSSGDCCQWAPRIALYELSKCIACRSHSLSAPVRMYECVLHIARSLFRLHTAAAVVLSFQSFAQRQWHFVLAAARNVNFCGHRPRLLLLLLFANCLPFSKCCAVVFCYFLANVALSCPLIMTTIASICAAYAESPRSSAWYVIDWPRPQRNKTLIFCATLSAVRLHWFPLHRVQLGPAEQLSGLLLHNRRSPWLRSDADACTLPLPAARSELEMELNGMVAACARDPGSNPFHSLRLRAWP